MTWIVSILFTGLLVAGPIRLVLFLRGRNDSLSTAERSMERRRLIALTIINISLSAFGLLCLFVTTYKPLDILMGVSLVVILSEVGFRKGSTDWAVK